MNVVITGASRGIGLELCKSSLENGDEVLAVCRNPETARGLNDLKKKFTKTLHILAVDLSGPEAIAKITAGAKAWPSIDVLINNAGVYHKGDKIEDFLNSFHVNSIVPFMLSRGLLPQLRKSQSPKVAQVTSLMGSIADNSSGGSHAYRASKTALNMLNKCLAVENGWLTAIVVHPGWVKTDMGGSGAPVEIPESANGIWRLVRELKPSDTGKFFDFRGKSLPW